jgi:hypothetical protein
MDATTKILLALIAGGLWVQIATAILKPTTANADESTIGLELSTIDLRLSNIARDVSSISRGACNNDKIC